MDDLTQWRRQLSDPDLALRAAAAEGLCLAGPDAAAAAVELARACADEPEVRDWAVAALESLGPPPQETLQALTESVGSPNPLTAYWSATLLGRLGPAAASSADALAGQLERDDAPEVQQRIVWALGKIQADSPQIQLALQRARQSSDPRLAALAKEAASPTGQSPSSG